jgi:L-ascorbate metabolism protein UlaG (beta-lactamase superfamily)
MSIERRTLLGAIAAAAALVGAAVGQEAERRGVAVTYLANEGLLIQYGDTGVVIDGLFREGVSGYARVPADELEKLETARAPYDKVKLLLVSHQHGDHFDARSAARHLEHNPKARLISSEQVVKQVRAAAKPDAKGRIERVEPQDAEKVTVEAGEVKVEVLELSHGSGRFAKISNLGHIIHIGGKRLLHVGDAELNPGTTEPLTRHARGVDIALVPYWMLFGERGRSFVQETLAPKTIVAIHVPPGEAESVTKRIQSHTPEAIVLTKPMTTRRF